MNIVTIACNNAAKRNRKKKAFWVFSTSWDLLGVSCADGTRCKIAFSIHLSQCEMKK